MHESDRHVVHGHRGVRHPFSHLGSSGRLGRDESRPRLLRRVRSAPHRRGRRHRGPRLLLHHRPGQRRHRRRHRGAPPVRRGQTRAAHGSPARLALLRPHARLPTALARPREGRDAHGGGRPRQRRLGPGRQGGREARLAVPRRHDARRDRLARRLPLPHRRPHPRRGPRPPPRRRTRPRRARRAAAGQRLPGVHHVARLARLRRREAGPPLQGGRRRGLRADQTEGRRRSPRRRTADEARPRRRRPRYPYRRRRQPALGRAGRGPLDGGARPVRPALDRGADQPRRHPRPRGRPRGTARQGRHRRTRRQPRRVQAAAPGRGRRLRPDRRRPCRRRQRERRDPAARRQVRRPGLPARGRRRPVRTGPAPLDVRLRRGLRHRRGPRHRVRRPPPRALRRPRRHRGRPLPHPLSPGFSARMHPESITAHRYPDGSVWQARRTTLEVNS